MKHLLHTILIILNLCVALLLTTIIIPSSAHSSTPDASVNTSDTPGQPRFIPPHVHNNLSRCPIGSGGCALFDENAIAISSDLTRKAYRQLYRHEMAHFIDYQLFTPRMRHRIKRLLLPKAKWFHYPYPSPKTKLWFRSAGEAFAVAYTLCLELRYWGRGDAINEGFGWWTKRELKSVCRLTNKIRKDKHNEPRRDSQKV